MNIRLEEPEDYHEVELLTREAFWNVYRPGCVEHYVVHRYRTNPDFIPELSFVLDDDGRIIGHVMFSKAQIVKDDGSALPAWTFGPISIHPHFQRKGLGLKLLSHAIARAQELGVALLCMEGNIDFYKHAGFDLASKFGIHYHAEPRESEVPYFLARILRPGYLDGVEATYTPPQGYMVATDDEEGFDAYETTFPVREKKFMPGQLPQFCQSCGMPLTSADVCGTYADGSTNFDYCRYCYADGHFTADMTMDQMITHCLQFVDDFNRNSPTKMTPDEYRQMMSSFFPMLKRWRVRE